MAKLYQQLVIGFVVQRFVWTEPVPVKHPLPSSPCR
jgi:hypothetical protein